MILVAVDILFVVGEAIRFLTASMPACGDTIRFLSLSPCLRGRYSVSYNVNACLKAVQQF